MKLPQQTQWLAGAVLVACLTPSGPAAAESIGEGGILYYDEYYTAPACWGFADVTDDVFDWKDVAEDHGISVGTDNVINAAELTDASRVSWGNDTGNLNVDENDITILATHGGVRPRYYDAYDDDPSGYSVDKAVFLLGTDYGNGDSVHPHDGTSGGVSKGCLSYGSEMVLGNNSDVEFFHAMSCQSYQYESWRDAKLPTRNRRLHQYSGFHGVVGIEVFEHAGEFAEAAFVGSVAMAWMDVMRFDTDVCPMVMVTGNDYYDALDRYSRETHNYPKDFEDADTTPWRQHYQIAYCNPEMGSPLPNWSSTGYHPG